MSKRAKLSQPAASEPKAEGVLPDIDSTGLTTSDAAESASSIASTLQPENMSSKLAPVSSQYVTADAHRQQLEQEGEIEDNSIVADCSNHHSVSKTKLKKKKKKKQEDLDEVPADPTSTSSTPDHLRYAGTSHFPYGQVVP